MTATKITLSLISHTNVGKTTLARTLLRQDVGEIRDQAHVTDESTAHTLLATDDAELVLWDTPGFGDTARLVRRLRRENDPVGWFLHQVWDRLVDRALWCGQAAVRNVREEADVVLYLVNAAEDPADAGYVELELELLRWIDRPVLLLLNQIGPATAAGPGPVEPWRAAVRDHPIVRDVLSLDAFTRAWVEEGILFRKVAGLLDGDRRVAMERLTHAWDARNEEVFERSCRQMAAYLTKAAMDRERLADGSKGDGLFDTLTGVLRATPMGKKGAMRALGDRLDASTRELMQQLIAEHRLYGDSAERIEQRVQDFQVRGIAGLNEKSGAVAGAVISGALAGLAADAMAGGLTLGGGLIAGGILGALGGAGLAKGYRLVGGRREPTVRWSTEFLDQLVRQAVLRYLAVAHFGRGRGDYRDVERPAHWQDRVDAALRRHADDLATAWQLAESDNGDGSPEPLLARIVTDATRTVLTDAYPSGAQTVPGG